MNAKERSAAWVIDQFDTDNWLTIPDFEINPKDVVFKGFAHPIVAPKFKGYELLCLIRELVKSARTLIRHGGRSLSQVRTDHIEVLDLMAQTPDAKKLGASHRQAMATYYILAMQYASNACRCAFDGKANFNEIAPCAEAVRRMVQLSTRNKSESIDIARTSLAQMGAKAKLAADPKQAAKVLVRECWDDWQKQPDRYKSKAAFAKDMLTKYESLENTNVIARWCRIWGGEHGTQQAQ